MRAFFISAYVKEIDVNYSILVTFLI